MLCARTAECLSYNFCHGRICQLNENGATVSDDLLVHEDSCVYVGIQLEDTPDFFDGNSSKNLGKNCDLEFKIGNLWVSGCKNKTNNVTKVSDVEMQSEVICQEMYCYRGERLVNQSYCEIQLGVPYIVYQANYAGNMTWEQGWDYCVSKGNKLRRDFSLF